uniref:Transporter n=1 Tax=Glossina palpalis gambiensis TaxID=67801 RepID=A0A1B0B7D6_9MUSC
MSGVIKAESLLLEDRQSVKKINNGKEQWGNGLEFLFSCISLSVGLGNIWRFPYIAFQNGGGTFVIPYLIVLLIIGRPIYYMEILVGQFSGKGCLQAFNMAPILKGVAAGQVLATIASITYYSSVMALTLRFLFVAFFPVLPWSYCRPNWGSECLDENSIENKTNKISPAELYFHKIVLREYDNIDEGIGLPNWDLVICLAISWFIIGAVLIKGIKSSGKVAYFLGTFPYIILVVLLIRAVTLPGAMQGIKFFFTPVWKNLINPMVWYAAVTQVFFSLAICFGTLITYASYNNFSRNVYNDIVIITTMDTCSSIIAGSITFGIVGHLSYETKSSIADAVKGGAGLAFITYPDAIAKFKILPQAFAILFFCMLFILGVGSTVGMGSCIIRVVKDRFPLISNWSLSVSLSVIGFMCSLVYMTPGGQFILNLVDFYGVSFTALILAIGELVAVGWIYGVKRFCEDIKFMLGMNTSIYWRLCWSLISPALLLSVLIYTLLDLRPLTYKNREYPRAAHIIGWCLTTLGLLQIPLSAAYEFYRQDNTRDVKKKFLNILKPSPSWGPLNSHLHEEYSNQRLELQINQEKSKNIFNKIYENIFG